MTSKQTRKMMKSRSKFKETVLERDNYICLWCGKPGTYETLDADHVTGRISQTDDVRAAGATIHRFPCHRNKTDGIGKWKASQLHPETIAFIEWRKWPLWGQIEWDRK